VRAVTPLVLRRLPLASSVKLEPRAVCARLAVLLRQPQSQRAVRIAELEEVDGLDGLGRRAAGDAARLQVRQRLRALLQGRGAIVGHLTKRVRIVGVEGHRRRQGANGDALDRHGALGRLASG